MVTIKDPIYGNLNLNQLETQLIDTEVMQRLRRVKQLAFVNLVYPGANHTRFEHSLGTMHLAGRLASKLDLDKQLFRVAGLLHDVGHGPYSHLLGGWKPHEEVTEKRIRNTQIKEILKNHSIPIEELIEIIKGRSRYSGIINGNIDVDRMDYLRRDAYYTGNPAGVISQDRIIGTSVKLEDKIGIKEKGKLAAESLLYGRHLMFRTVYQHHTVTAARKMAKKAIKIAFNKGKLTIEEAYRIDDEKLNNFFSNLEGKENEIWDKILSRQLYKVAYSDDTRRIKEINKKELKDNLMGKLDIKDHELLISLPEPKEEDIKVPILTKKGKEINLSEISPIAASLEKTRRNIRKLRILTPQKYREKVKKEAEDIL